MASLSPSDISLFLLGLAVMLGVARLFGELADRFGLPLIVGEILAGILLGPTLFGALLPDLSGALFAHSAASSIAFEAINTVAVVLLLMIAGLEVDLSVLWRQGRAALLVSILGSIVPFGLGFGLAYLAPSFWGVDPNADLLTFSLFFGIALSISALPVIAKILLDLSIFKTDTGMLIMAAAMFNDLVGWIVFSIVLGMMSANSNAATAHDAGFGIGTTIALTLGLVVFMLTAGRWLAHRVLPWIQARLSWPGGVLSFILVTTFAAAAVTEAIGIHAIFGAFLAGVAIGDSKYLREHTRTILHQFVTNIFAPIFFVSIGLRVDFLANFDLLLVLGVLAIAFVGKLAGCFFGARWGGLSGRESWAIGFGMNARGAMEIILGLLALQYRIIQEEMFIALVTLALVSSIVSGPAMAAFIVRSRRWALDELIVPDLFLPSVSATTRDEVIREMSEAAARSLNLPAGKIFEAVLARENLMGTGLGEQLAVPHARLHSVTRPLLVIGHSREGIDFDSPDGEPVRLIFLLLTPRQDDAAQVQIIGQIARFFRRPESRQLVYEGEPIDVLRASVKIERPEGGHG